MVELAAAGYIFLGQYLSTSYKSLEDDLVKYRGGVHVELTINDGPRLYVDTATLMDRKEDTGFHPVQVEYAVGVRHRFGPFEVKLEEKCFHPVDGQSNGGEAQDYLLLEGRINF